MNVYVHQNKINGKVYIGITHHDNLNRRWINGKGYFRNKHFSDAITKYGWKNFEHIVLFKDIPKEMACCVERELIRKYKANDKRFGYNITDGLAALLVKVMARILQGAAGSRAQRDSARQLS